MPKETTFVTILPFMRSELKLKGNDLVVYALIHGFTMHSNEAWFTGSVSYIEDWCGCGRATVFRILKRLTEAGLLERRVKEVNGVTLVDYRTTYGDAKKTLPVSSCDNPSLKTTPPQYQNEADPRLILIPQSIETTDRPKDRDRGKRFVPPSLEDCREYARAKGLDVDPDRFHEYFEAGDWHDSRGNPVRNWKQKMLTWSKHSVKAQRPATPTKEWVTTDYGYVPRDQLRTEQEIAEMTGLERAVYYNNAAGWARQHERGEI